MQQATGVSVRSSDNTVVVDVVSELVFDNSVVTVMSPGVVQIVGIQGEKGDKGDQGEQGVQGEQGPPGVGLPSGGNVGDFLMSNGPDDPAAWSRVPKPYRYIGFQFDKLKNGQTSAPIISLVQGSIAQIYMTAVGVTGTLEFNIFKANNRIPGVGDSIVGASPPSINSEFGLLTAPSDWITSVIHGDVFVASITNTGGARTATLILEVLDFI